MSDSENPKDKIGQLKLSYGSVPEISQMYLAAAHELGAIKYGLKNWRKTPVKASVYTNAIRRHLTQMTSGEWLDEESGLPHLALIMAGCSILLDAEAHGTLVYDLEDEPQVKEKLKSLTAMKAMWQAQFKDRSN